MAKQSGLGDNLYVGGYDISGDAGSISSISSPRGVLEYTGINKSAIERVITTKDGQIQFSTWFNDAAAPAAHAVLSGLPTIDELVTYARGTTFGNPAACMIAKSADYQTKREANGALSCESSFLANAYGLEWGVQLTPGLRTATGAENGSTYDTGGSLAFGGQAYLQVTAFTGTDATIAIQDAANAGGPWANVAGFAFTQVTSGPTTQRIAISNTSTIRQYVRYNITTTGGFNPMTFSVVINKNVAAGVTF